MCDVQPVWQDMWFILPLLTYICMYIQNRGITDVCMIIQMRVAKFDVINLNSHTYLISNANIPYESGTPNNLSNLIICFQLNMKVIIYSELMILYT